MFFVKIAISSAVSIALMLSSTEFAFAADTTSNANSGSVAEVNQASKQVQANGQTIQQNYAATKDLYQAPSQVIESANTTSPCIISGGAGGSFAGGSIGFTGGIHDEGCEMRSRVELLKNLGATDAALAYLCNADVRVRQAFVNIGKSCYPSPDTALKPTSQASVDIYTSQLKEQNTKLAVIHSK